MYSAKQDPREMTDEEAMKWMQELVNKLTEEKGSAGSACSLEALKNPIRRNIPTTLEQRTLSVNEISEKLKVNGPELRFHLNFLESSYFIRLEGNRVDLTPGGVSIVRNQKHTQANSFQEINE